MIAQIEKFAQSLGFDLIRVIKAEKSPEDYAHLKKWLSTGKNASMKWMENSPNRRANPSKILPGAKSVICLATNYYTLIPPKIKIARYAWSGNYHKIIEKRLKSLEQFIKTLAPNAALKSYVDTGPFLERSYAAKSGLGFIGKNTCLITKEFGSYVFLAEIITDLNLPPSLLSAASSVQPPSPSCGTCTRCIDACPTGALKPHLLDAHKCISYLTIESRKPFPKSLRTKIKPWIFGCDICQQACPHNVRARPTQNKDFALAPILKKITLKQLRAIKTEDEFKTTFAGTALIRAKFAGIKRNLGS